MSRDIVLAADTDADATTVYRALTTTEGLAAFWTPAVSGAAGETGADLRFGFAAAPAELEIRVEALEPDRRVAWTCAGPWPGWGGTDIGWRLTAAPEGGTRVILRHAGWADDTDDGDLGSVAFTWAQVLRALVAYAQTGAPQPALR